MAQLPNGYALKQTLVPANRFTKGARGTAANHGRVSVRTSVRFSVSVFDQVVKRIAPAACAGHTMTAEVCYPERKTSGGKARELPLAVNQKLMLLYWHIGRDILNRQRAED